LSQNETSFSIVASSAGARPSGRPEATGTNPSRKLHRSEGKDLVLASARQL
jgi:hypothetical protein